MWIFPLILLIIFEMVADIFAKEWSLKPSVLLWIGAIGAYVVANAFWLFALKEGSGLARGSAIFSVASAILALTIGAFLYKEQLGTVEYIGIGLGVASLVCIFWNDIIA